MHQVSFIYKKFQVPESMLNFTFWATIHFSRYTQSWSVSRAVRTCSTVAPFIQSLRFVYVASAFSADAFLVPSHFVCLLPFIDLPQLRLSLLDPPLVNWLLHIYLLLTKSTAFISATCDVSTATAVTATPRASPTLRFCCFNNEG